MGREERTNAGMFKMGGSDETSASMQMQAQSMPQPQPTYIAMYPPPPPPPQVQPASHEVHYEQSNAPSHVESVIKDVPRRHIAILIDSEVLSHDDPQCLFSLVKAFNYLYRFGFLLSYYLLLFVFMIIAPVLGVGQGILYMF